MAGLTKDYRPRFAVNAVLYWADTTNLNTFLGTVDGVNGQAVTLGANNSPPSRVEVRRYIVIPNNVQLTAKGLTFGPRNWRIISEQTLPSKPEISVASVYDLSQFTVNNNQVKQGVAYPELSLK